MRFFIVFLMIIIASCLPHSENQPMNFDDEFERALSFMDEGEYSKAKKIFLKLDKVSDEFIGVKMNLAIIEREKGNKKKAIEYLEQALKSEPNHLPLVKMLSDLTGNPDYERKATELENKVVEVSSEQYFKHFKERHPIVNKEYAKFDIRMKGQIIAIDKEKRIIYLKGEGESKSSSVICHNVSSLINDAKIGESIEFIGYSFGQGPDISEPIIVFKRKFINGF